MNSMRSLRSSFSMARAFSLGMAVTLLVAMLTGMLIVSGGVSTVRNEAVARNRLIAMTLANDVTLFLDSYSQALSLLSGGDFRTVDGVNTIARQYPAFSAVFTVDRDGRVDSAASMAGAVLDDVSMRPFYQEAIHSTGMYLSGTFVAEGDYMPTSVMAIPSVHGLAVGYLNLAQVSAFLMSLPVYNLGSVAVVDRNGYYVAHADRVQVIERGSVALETWFAKASTGSSDWMTVHKTSGMEEIVCWAPVGRSSGWTVVVAAPVDRVFRTANRFIFSLTVSVLVIGLAVLSMEIWLLLLLQKDIRAMRYKTMAVAEGDYRQSIRYEGFKDFLPLIRDFERAVEAIEDREHQLKVSRSRFERLLEALPAPALIVSPEGTITLMNEAITAMLGWTMDDLHSVDQWMTLV